MFHLKKQVSTFCSIPINLVLDYERCRGLFKKVVFFLMHHIVAGDEKREKKKEDNCCLYENDRNKKVAIYYFNTKVYSYYNKQKRNDTKVLF